MEAASFELFAAVTRTLIVPTELFLKQLVAVDDANAAFDFGFRWETSTSLTHRFEKRNLQKFRRA